MNLASFLRSRHTRNMGIPRKRGLLFLAVCALAIPAAADEIRLKDGKKLYGTIVAYEDNMFKVKTEFGYVLVEKDKIAEIIPTSPKPEPKPAVKKEAEPKAGKPAIEPAKATEKLEAAKEPASPATAPAAAAPNKGDRAAMDLKSAATATATATAPANKPGNLPATTASAAQPATPPAQPKAPEPPPNREEVQGNTYINYTNGFRMYKAPSWNLIEDARNALPNAIVALGTSSESTLLVIGREETKDSLEAAAKNVEQRLKEAYENYRRLEQKKTQVGGMPAIEYHYRGTAEEHDWSGSLVVIARGKDIFTVLGVTYADSDLIQIQENVIARAIASLDFSAH